MLPPGAVEVADGLISWVGDPWQVPPAAGHRGARARRPAHAGAGQLPRALAHDAGAQRGRRAAARPLAERVGLAPRGAAERRGRLLGHDARRGRAADQRHHHDVRAVPPPRAGRRGRARRGHPGRLHAGHLRGAGGPARQDTWEVLLDEACRLFDAMDGREGRLHLGFGPHAVYTVPPEGLRAIAAEAQRRDALVPDPPVGDGGRVRGGARALRHERAGAAGRRGALDGRVLAAHAVWLDDDDLDAAGRARRGGGALPRLQRQAGRGRGPAAAAAGPGGAGRARHRRPGLQRRPAPVGRDAARRRSWPGPPPATPARSPRRRRCAWPPAAAARRSACRSARSRSGGRPT